MSPFTSILEAVRGIPQRWYAWRTVRKLRELHRSQGFMPLSDCQIEQLFAKEEAALGPRTLADDLCDAAWEENLSEVKRLLAQGASATSADRRGNTPLFSAQDVEVMRTLFEAGASSIGTKAGRSYTLGSMRHATPCISSICPSQSRTTWSCCD